MKWSNDLERLNMNERRKVVIGLSGGVDSATAVHFLNEMGYEAIGLTLKMLPDKIEKICSAGEGFRVCCSKEAVMEAKLCAMRLGIAHYVIDCSKDFEGKIIDYFISEYMHAKTPSPCVFCNRDIKFRYLLRYASMMGADYAATGHYADIKTSVKYSKKLICKPADLDRDQSYMLCMLPPEYIEKIILPLGAYKKSETRAYAERLGLIVANKPDSQEICFIPDGDYRRFLIDNSKEISKIAPGAIVDLSGRKLGRHDGLINYTIGQRKGLGITSPVPQYVVRLDAARNEVVVASAEDAVREEFTAGFLNSFIKDMPVEDYEYEVKIRYKHNPVKARLKTLEDGRIHVKLSRAERGVTPGQILAIYDGEFLIGGAVILV